MAENRPPPQHGDGAEKSLERRIRAYHWVRLLAELPDRLAGSAGEREAAERVFAWMREIGFDEVAEQAVPGGPRPGLRLALPAGLGAVGVAAGGIAGLVLTGLALLCFRREQRQGHEMLSRLLPASDSWNVVARIGSQRPRRRVVLSASIDAPQAGWIFSRPLATRLGRGGALAACERALFAGCGVALASALGASGALLAAAQAGLALGLLGAAGLALQWGLSRAGPGGGDASGVAALLTCAEQLAAQLRDDAELWIVAAGAGHTGARGLLAFLDAHPDWQSDRTLLLHFDRVGGGALHYLSSEGVLSRCVYPPRLRELARRLAEGGAFADVTPADFTGETDARRAVSRGLDALCLVALDPDGAPHRDHAPDDVSEDLDMGTVVRAADFAAAVVAAAWRGESDPLAIV